MHLQVCRRPGKRICCTELASNSESWWRWHLAQDVPRRTSANCPRSPFHPLWRLHRRRCGGRAWWHSDPSSLWIWNNTADLTNQKDTLLTWTVLTRLASPWRQGCESSHGASSSSPPPQLPCSKRGTWPEWQRLRLLLRQMAVAS